jgi:hypothetical protein
MAVAFVEERFRRQDHARNAVAALHGAMFDEGGLQRMQVVGIAQSLDRDDRAAATLLGEQDA